MKPYRTAVVLGRFQIFHNAHKKLLDHAFTKADHVIVVLGSHLAALDIRNPFTASEREEMIRAVYPDKNLDFIVVADRYYNDKIWLQDVMSKVRYKTDNNKEVCIVGYYKDASSYYLDYFREIWAFEAVVYKTKHPKSKISATNIRNNYFNNEKDYSRDIPLPIYVYLENYKLVKSQQYKEYVDEYEYIKNYRERNRTLDNKYPVQYITVDNILVQNGHVLMVARKGWPGKGLWALPGGFVKPTESLLNGALRELKEETSISLNKSELRRCLADQHVFDHPNRDLRGRIITHGFFYNLEDNKPLPEVKGGDDAAKAFWVPWDELIRHSDRVYSDHVHIVSYFLNRF